MLSNKGISIWDLCSKWVKYIIGSQKEIIVALDWSSFFDDEQSMLSLNIVSSKGLSTPLLWQSVDKTQMKHNRARYKDQLLSHFKESLPEGVTITLLADRGFADQKFFRFLNDELKFNYIIRIKSNTTITHNSVQNKAVDLLRPDGRIFKLKEPMITLNKCMVTQFVAIKDKGMKAPWFLVSNTDLKLREIVNLYAKRWKIEPYFRDLKDSRYGLGLEQTHIKSRERRDRLMLILAISYQSLITLGQAVEEIGFDKALKVNTVKTRTHSLFRQGLYYYQFFHILTAEEQVLLMDNFNNLLSNKPFWVDLLNDEK